MTVRLDYTPDISDAYADRLRIIRDQLLKTSDWTQLPDAPLSDTKKAAWATYRQELRDFPSTWTPSPTADLPNPPAP
jgi:hypothetical protein